ncbi:hypothetical protein LCGC14_1741520, partial [marine sediment metagenome]
TIKTTTAGAVAVSDAPRVILWTEPCGTGHMKVAVYVYRGNQGR